MDHSITLENDRVLLSPFSLDHRSDLEDVAFEDKELLKYSLIKIYTKDYLTNYIWKSLNRRQNGLWYSFAVFDKDKDQFAGSRQIRGYQPGKNPSLIQ